MTVCILENDMLKKDRKTKREALEDLFVEEYKWSLWDVDEYSDGKLCVKKKRL